MESRVMGKLVTQRAPWHSKRLDSDWKGRRGPQGTVWMVAKRAVDSIAEGPATTSQRGHRLSSAGHLYNCQKSSPTTDRQTDSQVTFCSPACEQVRGEGDTKEKTRGIPAGDQVSDGKIP